MISPNQDSSGQGQVNQPQPQVQPAVTAHAAPIAEAKEVPIPTASTVSTRVSSRTAPNISLEPEMDLTATDILNLYRDHADIRRDVAKESSDIRQESCKGHGELKYAIAHGNCELGRDILTTSANTSVKVDEAADKIQQQATDFYIAGQARDFDTSRDLSALRAAQDLAAQKLSTEILLSSERAATATALESAKVSAAVALGQSTLSKEIAESKFALSREVAAENEKTRDLINSLKDDELNRLLIERNTDLQHCRHDYWGCRDGLVNSQFAALSSQVNSQLNALNSQVAETRQGLVNFGTMAGNAGQQSSTSNQVR
jgi:hypothetical protein